MTHDILATRIIAAFHAAETDLVGKSVETFNGAHGKVREVRLDDHHGLCFTLGEHTEDEILGQYRWYPVSTIRSKS